MVGSAVSLPIKNRSTARSEVRLRVDSLTLAQGTESLSFQIARGEILGIAGVAGNGQTELARALTGLQPVHEARITLDQDNLHGLDATGFHLRGVAHIPEDRNHLGVVPSMSVEENFLLRWIDSSRFRRGPLLLWKKIRQAVERLVSEYRIATPSALTRTSLLSGGNVQKLILAREFSEKPRLIVAVHPTYGLDVQAIAQVHQAFLEEAAQGTAILLISEDLDELMALADRIAVLFEKRIIGIADRASAPGQQRYHYRGAASTDGGH